MSLPPIHRLPALLRLHAHRASISALTCPATPFPRSFSSTPIQLAKPLPPRRPLLESEFTESFLRGSGPGGQKINKTSCAVQLKHLPTGIVVKCQETRSRDQNRRFARRWLQDKIEELELGDMARTRVKGREVATKKKSAGKKKRRKYRALGDEKGEDEGLEECEGEGEGEGAEAEQTDGQASAPAEGEASRHDTRVDEAGKAG
jgi:hypothetical protein